MRCSRPALLLTLLLISRTRRAEPSLAERARRVVSEQKAWISELDNARATPLHVLLGRLRKPPPPRKQSAEHLQKFWGELTQKRNSAKHSAAPEPESEPVSPASDESGAVAEAINPALHSPELLETDCAGGSDDSNGGEEPFSLLLQIGERQLQSMMHPSFPEALDDKAPSKEMQLPGPPGPPMHVGMNEDVAVESLRNAFERTAVHAVTEGWRLDSDDDDRRLEGAALLIRPGRMQGEHQLCNVLRSAALPLLHASLRATATATASDSSSVVNPVPPGGEGSYREQGSDQELKVAPGTPS
ncbi:hypothetical protein JKP88DRAFT_245390 [Tribonema minus]|uniref:Uncharacterized protein n=1 Tax=Tribonema minus TaxID=303371 RepID=A0A835YWI1_9STRA|nr:hypothetical protein JKP88DRAFT_245390 [Tribonema minus]